MASSERRRELGIDAATDQMMARVYQLLKSSGEPLSVQQMQHMLDIPGGERLSGALETLVLVKAVETGPATGGPAYRARANVDTAEWHAADTRDT